jgi:hypothetical protein
VPRPSGLRRSFQSYLVPFETQSNAQRHLLCNVDTSYYNVLRDPLLFFTMFLCS